MSNGNLPNPNIIMNQHRKWIVIPAVFLIAIILFFLLLPSSATSDNRSTFLVFGATGREEAISQYSQLLGEKLRS